MSPSSTRCVRTRGRSLGHGSRSGLGAAVRKWRPRWGGTQGGVGGSQRDLGVGKPQVAWAKLPRLVRRSRRRSPPAGMGRSSRTPSLNAIIDRSESISSAITIATVSGQERSSPRRRGSKESTIERRHQLNSAAARPRRSAFIAFFEIQLSRADALIGITSARCNCPCEDRVGEDRYWPQGQSRKLRVGRWRGIAA